MVSVSTDTIHFFTPFFTFQRFVEIGSVNLPYLCRFWGGMKCKIYCIDNKRPKIPVTGQKKPTWLGWADNQSRGIVENEKACPPAPFP